MADNVQFDLAADPLGILEGEQAPAEPQNTPDATDEEKKLISALADAFQIAKKGHADRKGLIDFCTLMLKGEPLIAQLKNSEYLRTVVDGSNMRPRSTDNKLRVANRAFIAKLIKIIPTVRTKARTDDREDMIAASVIDSFLDFRSQNDKLKLKYKRWVSWIPRAGMGVAQVLWNPDRGRRLLHCPKCDSVFDRKEYSVGDPCPACSAEMQAQSEQAAAMGSLPPGLPAPGAAVGPALAGPGIPIGYPAPMVSNSMPAPAIQPAGGPAALSSPPTPQAPGPAGVAPSPAGPSPIEGLTGPSTSAIPQAAQPPALEEIAEGDIETRILDPRDFFPDPGATHPEDMTYAFVSRVLPVAVVRKMFPDKWQQIQKEDGLYSDKYITATYSTGMRQARIETRYLRNHVRLYEYHEIPSGKYPKGRIVFYCNDRLLKIMDNIPAYLIGRLPFFLSRGDVDDGELWPEPIILQAEALQRERDDLMTKKRHHRNLTVNPPFLSPVGSGINDSFLDFTPGKNIRYKAAVGVPKPLQVAQFPPSVAAEPAELERAIFEKWGVTAHETGQVAGSEDSGRLAAMLDTQAQAVVAAMLVEIYAEWLELYRAHVILAQRYYDVKRVWTATGSDRTQLITNSWAQAEVKEGWDLFFVEDDAMSKNPVMRLNQALDLQAKVPQLFVDPSTGRFNEKKFRLQAGLKLEATSADAETAEHIYAAKIPDAIEAALNGEGPMPEAKAWDDPWIMIEELRAWLQTKGRSAKPELVQAVFQFWSQYIQWVLPTQPGQMVDPTLAKLLPSAAAMGGGQPPQQPPSPTAGPGPGGIPGNVQGGTATQQQTPNQEAAGKVQGADRAAERMARGNLRHEG